MGDYKIEMFKGDTYERSYITTYSSSGLPYNLYEVVMTARLKTKLNLVSFERKNTQAGGSDAEIEMITTNKFRLKITPAVTADLGAGTYVFDIESTLADGTRKTLFKDILQLTEDVTKH